MSSPSDFPNKTTMYRHCKVIIESVENNEIIQGEAGEFVHALFARHPHQQSKILDRTISHFTASTNKGGSRCFYAVFNDRSMVAFSYRTCGDEIFK